MSITTIEIYSFGLISRSNRMKMNAHQAGKKDIS
jgi:hypothetical protein